MADEGKVNEILVSWIGLTDLKASAGELKQGEGPVAAASEARKFDLVVLLGDSRPKETNQFLKWIKPKTAAKVEQRRAKISSPIHFRDIYAAVDGVIRKLKEKYGTDVRFTYHLNPGTYVMAAVWIILAKTRHAAELIDS